MAMLNSKSNTKFPSLDSTGHCSLDSFGDSVGVESIGRSSGYRALSSALILVTACFGLVFAHAQSRTSEERSEASATETAKMPRLPKASAPPAAESLEFPNSSLRATQPSSPFLDALSFNIRQESFLNREKPPAGVPDYTRIGAHFKTEGVGRIFRGRLELGGSFATSVENDSNLYVPEAFLEWRTAKWYESELDGEPRVRVNVGRRLEMWSQLDRNFDLGLWEPLNRYDAIRPVDQGLTGLFLEGAYGQSRLIFFISNIYIPEQGGGFRLQNGRFQSTSPWFTEPTDRLILFSESTQVQYDIRTPSIGSVINHPSGGMIARYGDAADGFFAQASYAFKPRNQLATPFEGSLNLTDTTSFAQVNIEPVVVYHQLMGGELAYRRPQWGVAVSALVDAPLARTYGPDLTYPEMQPQTFVSPSVEARLPFAGSSELQVQLSYLDSFGGGQSLKGPFATDKAVFGPRTPWKKAAMLDARTVVGRGRRTEWSLGGRWLEELSENGSLLMAEASVDFAKLWQFALMVDVLGTRLPPNENVGTISRFRGNDRVMSELRFVF